MIQSPAESPARAPDTMKLLYDTFPVILFFVAYKLAGIYVATAVAIAASALQVSLVWLVRRQVERMHLITLGVIVIFGGATLLLQEEIYVKWKPTVVNWLFAAVFLASHFIGRRPIVQRLLDHQLDLPTVVWNRLNLSWVAFFVAMGVANLYVVYHFSTDTWVDFKLFGVLGLTFAFVIGQGLYLARHVREAPDSDGGG